MYPFGKINKDMTDQEIFENLLLSRGYSKNNLILDNDLQIIIEW